MATSIAHEADDLNTCAVCFEQYNHGDRLPKHLSCLHTFCISCLGVSSLFKIAFYFSLTSLFLICIHRKCY